jgi:Kef-type K+ transport system membrane component KefB
MSDLFFLPDWPLDLAQFPWFAVLLLAAVGMGEAVQRYLRLPRLLGWIAAGVLLGPHALGFFSTEMLGRFNGLIDVALGLVLFELGQRVDLSWLRRNPWLLGVSVLEAGLSFAAAFFVLALTQPSLLVAARLPSRWCSPRSCARRARSPSASCCSPRSTAATP